MREREREREREILPNKGEGMTDDCASVWSLLALPHASINHLIISPSFLNIILNFNSHFLQAALSYTVGFPANYTV